MWEEKDVGSLRDNLRFKAKSKGIIEIARHLLWFVTLWPRYRLSSESVRKPRRGPVLELPHHLGLSFVSSQWVFVTFNGSFLSLKEREFLRQALAWQSKFKIYLALFISSELYAFNPAQSMWGVCNWIPYLSLFKIIVLPEVFEWFISYTHPQAE